MYRLKVSKWGEGVGNFETAELSLEDTVMEAFKRGWEVRDAAYVLVNGNWERIAQDRVSEAIGYVKAYHRAEREFKATNTQRFVVAMDSPDGVAFRSVEESYLDSAEFRQFDGLILSCVGGE